RPESYCQTVLLEVEEGIEVEALGEALRAVAWHHDALRHRFRRENGRWEQEGTGSLDEIAFRVVEGLSSDQAERALSVARIAEEEQDRIDLAKGVLLRAAAIRGPEGTRLLLVIHHLVSDRVSWEIVLEDLETACRPLAQGREVVLPAKTTGFRQ